MPGWYQWSGDRLILTLHVVPRSKRDEVAHVHGDALKVKIAATPVDGKANERLLDLIASEFNVSRHAISLLSGRTSRRKRVAVMRPDTLPFGIKKAT